MDLFWIDPFLAVSSRPRGGDWLQDEIADLQRQGVDVLVSCLTSAEERELDLSAEERFAASAGLTFVRAPMADRGVPASPSSFEETIQCLASYRDAGLRVSIHCRQGLGRAPLVAAALLVRSGASPDEAWSLISERRDRPVPDTDEQRDWIRSFAERGR